MTARVGSATAVLGGGSMSSSSYADFLGQEYLASYLPAGGGSVKLVVAGDADVADEFERSLRAVANRRQCLMVSLSAETTRAQMVDQVFFALARQIDWDQIAVAIVRTV